MHIVLIVFRMRSTQPPIWYEHFKTAKINTNYCSKTIENEIIPSCGKYTSQSITKEIKESEIFSVLADEGKDVSNKEQMVLVIRFVDSKQEIQEGFMWFIHCDAGMSG